MGRIFINYRRKQNQSEAELLAALLTRSFGKRGVFIDKSGLDGGDQWVQSLERQIDASSAMLVIIGPGWAAATDSQQRRRLDDPDDFVRFEIARAFSRRIPVLPVLLDEAEVPGVAELPRNLLPLLQVHAVDFRANSREADAQRIVQRLRSLIAERGRRSISKWVAGGAVAGVLIGATFGPAALNFVGLPPPDTSFFGYSLTGSSDRIRQELGGRLQHAEGEREAALTAQGKAEAEAKAATERAQAADRAKAAAEANSESESQLRRKADAASTSSRADLDAANRELAATRAKLATAESARAKVEKDSVPVLRMQVEARLKAEADTASSRADLDAINRELAATRAKLADATSAQAAAEKEAAALRLGQAEARRKAEAEAQAKRATENPVQRAPAEVVTGKVEQAASNAGVVTQGAGTTFLSPIHAKWADAFRRETGIGVSYQSSGNVEGIRQIKARTVAFAASDGPLRGDKELDGLAQFPMVMGGLVPVVNIDGIGPGDLVLDGPTLANIYLGRVQKWDDAAIARLNPGMRLPSMAITLIRRSDMSRTTYNLTYYLSEVSPDWKTRFGTTNNAAHWPAGIGAGGVDGVANNMVQTKGSIGYLDYADAKRNKLTFTRMVNKAGKAVSPTVDSFQAAGANADWKSQPGYGVVLADQPGDASWPMTMATWILVEKKPAKPAETASALRFFAWSYARGQDMAKSLDYAPIPAGLFSEIQKMWVADIKDSNGRPLLVGMNQP